MDEFSTDRSRWDGKQPRCKRCRKDYHLANIDRDNACAKAYYEVNTDKVRSVHKAYNLKWKFGLTLDQYDQMFEDQLGQCANPGCSNEPTHRRFGVDHDRKCCPGDRSCGKCIRGLLCHACNVSLGLLLEDIKRIQGLADYLNIWTST